MKIYAERVFFLILGIFNALCFNYGAPAPLGLHIGNGLAAVLGFAVFVWTFTPHYRQRRAHVGGKAMKDSRNSGFTVVELLICVFFLAVLAGAGFLVYVAFHFISKVW